MSPRNKLLFCRPIDYSNNSFRLISEKLNRTLILNRKEIMNRSYLCASFSTLTLWSWLPGSEEVRCHSCCSVLMVNVPAGNFVNMCLKLYFKTFFYGKIMCFVMDINVISHQSAISVSIVYNLY